MGVVMVLVSFENDKTGSLNIVTYSASGRFFFVRRSG